MLHIMTECYSGASKKSLTNAESNAIVYIHYLKEGHSMATIQVRKEITPEYLNNGGADVLPGLLGVEIVSVEQGRLTSRMPITPKHLAINGYLHAASVIALADTSCGNATIAHLPEGAKGFTTIETKCNHIGTLHSGTAACTATIVHGGRSTQVWDATVYDEATGKTIAAFRCTQMILR